MTDPVEWLFALEQFGIKFGLGNMTAIVEGLGHPERAFPSVHVAGTNGKGSVTAMVDTALLAEGRRSARYTSPHLVDLTERFVIGGRPVDRGVLASAVTRVRTVVEDLLADGRLEAQPTFFEVTTAVAFELFRRAGVDIAVCEVGLGGRLDATNVLQPVVTAITSIGLDHEQYLGQTLRDIAIEKAGIIKPGVPVVVGRMPAAALEAIEEIARRRQAPIVHAGAAADRAILGEYGDATLALPGDHQVSNAVVAVQILRTLQSQGLELSKRAVISGLTDVVWPGRLDARRLPDGREMLLDAAHNPEGAAALAAFLATRGADKPPLVFGAMRDKDAPAMLRALAPAISALIVTRAGVPRAADPFELAGLARAVSPGLPVTVQMSPRDALAEAWRVSPRIVVAGSIFLLGEVLSGELPGA